MINIPISVQWFEGDKIIGTDTKYTVEDLLYKESIELAIRKYIVLFGVPNKGTFIEPDMCDPFEIDRVYFNYNTLSLFFTINFD